VSWTGWRLEGTAVFDSFDDELEDILRRLRGFYAPMGATDSDSRASDSVNVAIASMRLLMNI
jgi:hypothetical protein